MNDKFCPLPWIFQAVRNNGDIRVCCQANPSISKGIYRRKDGTVYNAKDADLQESRNCDLAKEVRRTMLKGETHEACIRCDREDASGINSRRQYENELWKDIFNFNDAVKKTNEDGTINVDEVPVIYYDLRFGNLCNLKCRMCGPTDSNQWYEDWVKAWNKEWFDDSHGRVELVKNAKNRYTAKFDDYSWFESDIFWEQVDKNIPNIRQIHTVGGEPLMIDKHYDLLQRCVDQGYAKNIVVEYNTNLTNIPKRAWDIWPHFKRVQFGVSIDAVGELNDYIRNPSNFDKLAENLHKIDNAEGNFRVWIACTVQLYNVAYITDFMKWILEQDFKNIGRNEAKPILNPHPLHNPPFLNTKTLPKAAKEWIRTRYDEFYIWLEQYIKDKNIDPYWAGIYRFHTKKILEGYYDIMVTEDWSDKYLKDFWIYSTRIDAIRNESFQKLCPEIYQFIKDELEK